MAKTKTISPLKLHQDERRDVVVAEAIIRPTGLLDPEIILKPVSNQVDDVLEQVRQRVKQGQRVLITTLTKKFAEELDIYMKQIHIKSAYIHSDVDTIERVEILADLRRGKYDVLIGINLLREGLDLPEVSLVAIFDADKEGFLRSKTSLIQIIGRAARHVEGTVIMYADTITKSMQYAIDETERRRELQIAFNHKHGIVPQTTTRGLQTIADDVRESVQENQGYGEAGARLTVSGFEKTEENTMDTVLDEALEIENRFAKKSSRRRLSRSVHGDAVRDQKSTRGKQVYADFDSQKAAYIAELRTENATMAQLESRLHIAIDAYDFEMAAAIRDVLEERESEL